MIAIAEYSLLAKVIHFNAIDLIHCKLRANISKQKTVHYVWLSDQNILFHNFIDILMNESAFFPYVHTYRLIDMMRNRSNGNFIRRTSCG